MVKVNLHNGSVVDLEINSLSKNGFRFLALIITPWHLYNLQAFIKQNELTNGLIVILPQKTTNGALNFRLSKSEISTEKFHDCEIVEAISVKYSYDIKAIISRIFTRVKHNDFWIITPTGVNSNLLLNNKIGNANVYYGIIDEGLGTYMSPLNFEQTKYENKKNKFNKLKRTTFILKPYLIRILCFILKVKVDRKTLFVNKQGKLFPRENICEALKKLYLQDIMISENEPCILFFKDYGVISTSTYSNFFRQLFKQLEGSGKKIFVKKHPNDVDPLFDDIVSSYNNVKIVNEQISGEQLVAKLNPLYVVGGFTTAIFSAAAIFDIRVYSFMTMYLNYKIENKAHLYVIQDFYQKLEGNIKNLEFIKELKDIK